MVSSIIQRKTCIGPTTGTDLLKTQEKVIMKRISIILALAAVLGNAHAQSDPVVGLWEKIAVSDSASNLVARTSYVFTNTKLTEETVFTAFQSAKPMVTMCCIKVKNLKPVELKDVLSKYSVDDEFVDHMKSVKGASYMYEAVPVDKKEWNSLMTKVMKADEDPDNQVPVHAPVIAAKLSKEDEKLGRIELGPTKVNLSVKYKDGKAFYQFTVNGKQTTFSDETFPH